jgi:SAM-dependent methyltransferase
MKNKKKGENHTVAVFGTSTAARIFMETAGRDYEVKYFVDNDPARRKKRFYGRPVKDPEVLRADKDIETLIIALENGKKRLRNQLMALGVYKKSVYYKDIHLRVGTFKNVTCLSGLADYYQERIGITESFVAIRPKRIVGALLSPYEVLNAYSIKGNGRGYRAVKAMLKKIFAEKIKRKLVWDDSIWSRAVVVRVSCDIVDAQSGEPIHTRKPQTLTDINFAFAHLDGKRRERQIYSLAEKLRTGVDIPPPVYVSGSFLNALKAKVNERSLFMLDGARRLSATLLNHRGQIDIYIVFSEDEFPRLLDASNVQRISTNILHQKWFNAYQSIPLVGYTGERSTKRFDLIDWSMFAGKTVLDFGCNIGQMCIKARQAGAARVIGFDGMSDTVRVAKQIRDMLGFRALEYYRVDFNNPQFDTRINARVRGKADYSFFLSVYRTKELRQRDRLFQYIIKKTRTGIFFEGHANTKIDTIEYYDWLFETYCLAYQFLGYTEKRCRPLFYIDLKRTRS